MFGLARGKSAEPYGTMGGVLCSMPGTYSWSAHQTSARQAGVQKKEKLAAGSELFVHTPGITMNRAPSVFRAPLKPFDATCTSRS